MSSFENNLDYRELFSSFVDREYVNMIDDEALETAEQYSELGGSPRTCVAVGLTESDNTGLNLEEIASELDVSRRAVYNARDELELVDMDVRGVHKK